MIELWWRLKLWWIFRRPVRNKFCGEQRYRRSCITVQQASDLAAVRRRLDVLEEWNGDLNDRVRALEYDPIEVTFPTVINLKYR